MGCLCKPHVGALLTSLRILMVLPVLLHSIKTAISFISTRIRAWYSPRLMAIPLLYLINYDHFSCRLRKIFSARNVCTDFKLFNAVLSCFIECFCPFNSQAYNFLFKHEGCSSGDHSFHIWPKNLDWQQRSSFTKLPHP